MSRYSIALKVKNRRETNVHDKWQAEPYLYRAHECVILYF